MIVGPVRRATREGLASGCRLARSRGLPGLQLGRQGQQLRLATRGDDELDPAGTAPAGAVASDPEGQAHRRHTRQVPRLGVGRHPRPVLERPGEADRSAPAEGRRRARDRGREQHIARSEKVDGQRPPLVAEPAQAAQLGPLAAVNTAAATNHPLCPGLEPIQRQPEVLDVFGDAGEPAADPTFGLYGTFTEMTSWPRLRSA